MNRFARILRPGLLAPFAKKALQQTFPRLSQKSSNGFLATAAISIVSFGSLLLLDPFSKTLLASSEYTQSLEFLKQITDRKKLFEEYASLTLNGEKYMTTYDLLRALSLDEKSEAQHKMDRAQLVISAVFQLADLDFDGKISFSEFIFFLKLISTPSELFQVAFNMFDLDGSGSLELPEFRKFLNKKGNVSEQDLKRSERGLLRHFFKREEITSLTFSEFSQLMTELQFRVHQAQFDHHHDSDGTISGFDFARILISNANLLPDFVDRLQSLPPALAQSKITFKEFVSFHKFLENISTVDVAMRLISGTSSFYKKEDFYRAAKAVSANLSQAQMEIFFHVIDRNGDGKVGRPELLAVATRHSQFASAEVKASGIQKRIHDFVECVRLEE